MYDRRVSGKELTFAFHPSLHENNLMLIDMETGSKWNQLSNRALDGELKGKRLKVIPSMQTTWKHWKSLHPDTQVIKLASSGGLMYRYAPTSGSVYVDPNSGTAAQRIKAAAKLDEQELVLGLSIDGKDRAYPFSQLENAESPLRDKLGRKQVKIHFDADARAAWATELSGRLLPAVTVYWSAWKTFHGKTDVYRTVQ